MGVVVDVGPAAGGDRRVRCDVVHRHARRYGGLTGVPKQLPLPSARAVCEREGELGRECGEQRALRKIYV